MQSSSPEQTKEYGKQIASELDGGDIVLLEGKLGAGKTTLVKGIAQGLGIEDDIVSPTFTLMNVYHPETKNLKPKTFIHVDTYRLEKEQELIDIGIDDYLGEKDTICIIEWPEKISRLLENKKTKTIKLFHSYNDTRAIEEI